MAKKLRAGVVGCGGIANGKHLPAIKQNGNFELVAFCDLIVSRKSKRRIWYRRCSGLYRLYRACERRSGCGLCSDTKQCACPSKYCGNGSRKTCNV